MPDRDADDAAPFPATPPDGAGRPPAHDGDTLRRLLSRSFANSERMIARARPQDMEDSTPCSLFDVRALVGHMLFAAERVGAAGRREAITSEGPAVTGLEDERWAGAFSGAAASALEAWEAPGSMEGEIELPFGSFPAPVVAKIYVVEQTTHAWDLATALQAEDALDAELATEVLPIAAEIILPEYRGEEPMPFGAIVPLPSKSPDYDRLAAFMGRRPPAA